MDKELLEKLEQRLRKECRNIKLTETVYTIDNDETSLTQSKVLGDGFFPASMVDDYPRSKDGTPYVMFTQMNFAEVQPMEQLPKSGLLQLYVNPFDWSGDDYVILFFDEEKLKEESLNVYDELLWEWLDDADYYLPAQRVHTMTFEKGYSYAGQDDRFYEHQLSLLAQDYSAEVVKEYVKEHSTEFDCRIGGYSDFAQYDPRSDHPCFQLLQLDSVEGINFCDCGILHLFIPEESLSTGEWDDVVMYVDWY